MKILHLTNKNNKSNFIKTMVVEKGFEYIFYDQDINYDLEKLQQINLVLTFSHLQLMGILLVLLH